MRLCSSCRLFLDRQTIPLSSDESSNFDEDINNNLESISQESLASMPSAPSVDSTVGEYSQSVNIDLFNKAISAILTSPIDKKKMCSESYTKKKCDEIVQNVRKNLFALQPEVRNEENNSKYFDEMIEQIKEKYFAQNTTQHEKFQLLTILPRSWTIQQIIDTFNTTRHTATQAKKTLDERGILAQKPARVSTGLKDDTKELVMQFFESDEISRAMPGKRDCVSLRKEGKRQSVQKRLMMYTLRETSNQFLKDNAEVKIGFSTFAKLRPQNCKLLSNSGSHNVCVCTIHENVDLILHSLKKRNIQLDLKTLTKNLMCPTETRDCLLRRCNDCKDSSMCSQIIFDELDERCINEIQFEQWVTTDRCDIETLVKETDEFVPYLISKLEKFIPHDFIKKEQSIFLKNCKNNLKDGEFVVTCDFSENYSFVLQDEVQSHHWNNRQATIHPFVIYYRKDGKLNLFSFVVISEDLRHDSISVNLFISKMVNFLRVEKQLIVNKIIFISDGAASQYKNRKNFASLCQFKNKYNIEVQWHFFATSHGKGPCDAIGGTLKRMATRASLAKAHEHPIKNARELYEWAQMRKEQELSKLNYCFSTCEEYDKLKIELNELYLKAQTIRGTQKYHSFIPISTDQIEIKLYSNDTECKRIENIFKN